MKGFIKGSLRFIKQWGFKGYCSQLWRESWEFISCEYLKPYLSIETKAYLKQHDKYARHMQHMLDLEHQTYIEDTYWPPMYE